MFNLLKRMVKKGDRPLFCTAIVPAAGNSTRMGGENKLFAEICGVPVLGRTVEVLSRSELIGEIIVATRSEDLLAVAEVCRAYAAGKPVKVVCGGATRMESVMAALAECDPQATLVAVHDGARPLVTLEIIDRTIRQAEKCYAAAPAIPLKDTIKVADGHIVLSTPNRDTLRAIQTPQVFDRELLQAALQSAAAENAAITDDCSAVERLGKEIYLTEGSDENIKITTPVDLIMAEAIWDRRG